MGESDCGGKKVIFFMKKIYLIMLIILAIVAGLFFYTHFSSHPAFRVVFLNVGQGDATLIDFNNGARMLVDCGPDRKILSKLGKYLPFFDRQIDYLLISHPDLDHYGGCVDVLKRYDIKNIIGNGAIKTDPYFQTWEKYVQKENAQNIVIATSQNWEIGSSTLQFLSPDPGLGLPAKEEEGNNLSIVFKLINGDESFLLTGDAEEILENALVKKHCPSSTIPCEFLHSNYLKLGHHGSDSSSGEAFLQAVAPDTAIISVGKNTFGHPSRRILKRLERADADIWRTDVRGDIILQ